MILSTAPDRRSALKSKHRESILRAARDLVDERGGPRFSVDELAARADIARRTVFNHFASIDEVLLTLCGDALDVLIDDFVAVVAAIPVGDDSRRSMFDEIAQSLRSSDLPTAIATVARILGSADPREDDPRGRALSDEAFTRAASRLLAEVRRRHPGVEPLEAELLVNSMMSGVIVVARHWVIQTGISLDDEGRDAWQHLLTRLIDHIRSGYSPPP